MVVNVKKKPPEFVVFDFFGRNFHHPLPPLPPSQSQDPRIHDIASSSNTFENFKFSKILNEDAISRIRESCDCDGEKLDDENRAQKNRKRRFNFFGRDSRHPTTHTLPHPIAIIARPSMGDKNHAKKIENVGLIFLEAIFIPRLSQFSQDPRICDIESSNIFGNLLVAISNLRGSDYNGGGGGTKIAAEKMETSRPVKSTDINLLGLAAPPIWPATCSVDAP